MAVTKEYDKFDDKYEFRSEMYPLNSPLDSHGYVNAFFTVVKGKTSSIGWLVLARHGEDWAWLNDSRLIVLSDKERFEFNESLRASDVLDDGNVFERLDVSFELSDLEKIVNAEGSVEGKICGFQFGLPQALTSDLRMILEMASAK